ncbi:MAG: YpdA family putative bacillithiol disulfide reductase [Gemmatimonadota bacterium]
MTGSNHPTRPPTGPEDDQILDLAIIGAGPCGIAVGAAARKAGLSARLYDSGALCEAILHYPPYMSFFSTPEKLEVEGVPFVTVGRNPSRKEALTYYRKVAEYFDLDVRQYRKITSVAGSEGDFTLHTQARSGVAGSERARRVVIATGGFHQPNLLGVPGEDLPKVSHYYQEAHPYWRQDVLIVGGSNSAVEAALELFRSGSHVTLVHFLEDFDRGVKPWVLPDIRNRVEKGEVEVRWAHRVTEIRPEVVVVRNERTGETEEVPNDWVLALTGWRSDPELLRSLGAPVDDKSGVPAHDPETMETPVPGVFIAGVLAAGNDANRIFIENGRWHGGVIVDAIREREGGVS